MRRYTIIVSIVSILLSIIFTLVVPSLAFNYSALLLFTSLDALVFWVPLTLIIMNLIRPAVRQTLSKLGTALGAGIFFGYLIVHYFVYSLVLEKIISSLSVAPYLPASSFYAFLSATPFSGLLSPVFSLTLNPTGVLLIPPYFELDLSPFSIVMGLMIAVLVTASLTRIMEVRGKMPAYYLLIPVGGVVTGASCCISLPFLIADFTPLSSAILLSPISGVVLLIAYYALPLSTTIALAVHVRLLFRVVPKSFRMRETVKGS